MITVTGISNGGYIGQCLSLQVRNNTNTQLDISVDPALIFRPSDTTYQDLVAVGGEQLALEPKKDKKITLQTFCGKSYAHAPIKNLAYKFLKQGSEKMQKVVAYIRENNLLNHLGQHAVWMFTNKHQLTSVCGYSPDETTKKFVHFIAKTTGTPVPDFYVKYKDADTARYSPVFNEEVKEYIVDINWNFLPQRNLHIGIFKENGDFYRPAYSTESISTNGHSVLVKMYPKSDPDGKYFVRLYDDDNQVYVQKNVVVGMQDYN